MFLTYVWAGWVKCAWYNMIFIIIRFYSRKSNTWIRFNLLVTIKRFLINDILCGIWYPFDIRTLNTAHYGGNLRYIWGSICVMLNLKRLHIRNCCIHVFFLFILLPTYARALRNDFCPRCNTPGNWSIASNFLHRRQPRHM